jgi:hypothetical protein
VATIGALIALGTVVLVLGAIVLIHHRRRLNRLERRLRALGVVESVIREASKDQPRGRHLRRVKAIALLLLTPFGCWCWFVVCGSARLV